jgi:hypothetical protein
MARRMYTKTWPMNSIAASEPKAEGGVAFDWDEFGTDILAVDSRAKRDNAKCKASHLS